MQGKYVEQIRCTGDLNTAAWLDQIPAVGQLLRGETLTFRHDVTILAGENGSGKSTLLEAIAVACGFNPEGGTKNFTFSTRATHSPLHQFLTVSKSRHETDGFFLRAEGFYNMATYIEHMDQLPAASYGGRSLHDQSHGESFLAAVQNRFAGHGLYLLDEPEAALSPMKQLTLLCELKRLVKLDSQLILATHSPILMAYPGAEILWLSETGIRPIAYEETEHVRIARQFLENPSRMLHYLLEESPD